MKNIFALIFAAALMLTGCDKQFGGENRFNFSREGGPWFFTDVVIDGESLSVTSGGESFSSIYWPEASADGDGLWVVESSWAYVYYQPSRQTLRVMADRNETGAARSLEISGSAKGRTRRFLINQSG